LRFEVVRRRKEPLLVAGAIPQLIGSARILRRQGGLPDVAIHAAECRVE
jgi:hypothetical protein